MPGSRQKGVRTPQPPQAASPGPSVKLDVRGIPAARAQGRAERQPWTGMGAELELVGGPAVLVLRKKALEALRGVRVAVPAQQMHQPPGRFLLLR
jgi:hypothetical protein